MIQNERAAGILLPIFSLPTPHGIGDFGKEAYQFIDQLKTSHQKIWSVLPHTPTGYGNSPYQPCSAFAGNPYFISPEILKKEGLLSPEDLNAVHFLNLSGDIDYGDLFNKRYEMLRLAYKNWQNQNQQHNPEFLKFCVQNRYWLKDYAVFMSIKEKNGFKCWDTWEYGLKTHNPSDIALFRQSYPQDIQFWEFVQFQYFKQWKQLKEYANSQGIKLMGDMPFYVGMDSCDVWSHPNDFNTSNQGIVNLKSGVPGANNQPIIWGNPCYNWQRMYQNGYEWFLNRFNQMSELYDIVRIDHANALVQFYGISNQEKKSAKWYPGPDSEKENLTLKLDEIAKRKNVKIVLEDLGHRSLITKSLFKSLDWDKMRVFQFTFNWIYGLNDIHLPEFYTPDMTVYTGTHDNEPLEGLLKHETNSSLRGIKKYLKVSSKKDLRWSAIKKLYMSTASRVILPLQDILGLDNCALICDRSNYDISWRWRLKEMGEFTPHLQKKVGNLTLKSGRSSKVLERKINNEKQR